MKIKVNDVELTARAVKTMTCPAGTAYWRVEYCLNEETVYAAHSRAMYGQPSPIEALGWTVEVWQEDDGSDRVQQWEAEGGGAKRGYYARRTVKEMIVAALKQIVTT